MSIWLNAASARDEMITPTIEQIHYRWARACRHSGIQVGFKHIIGSNSILMESDEICFQIAPILTEQGVLMEMGTDLTHTDLMFMIFIYQSAI